MPAPNARVLAVNIGAARLMDVRGEQVETSIVKRPVEGACAVGPLGLEGDGRVVPRKMGDAHHAVYIYPHEHYAYWQAVLGRDALDLGQFGENLTTEGLDERRVRVGDLLRVGTALLQVAHPRIPCKRLDARMGVPRFSKQFLASRRVGFYLRVLEPGHVAAGDAIELVDSDGVSPTIDAFVRVALFDYWDTDGIEALLAARDLVPGWATTLTASLERARAADGWLGLRGMRVVSASTAPPDGWRVTLTCALGKPLPAVEAGQALTVRFGDSSSSPRRRLPIMRGDAQGYEIALDHATLNGADPELLTHEIDEIRCGAPSGLCVLTGLLVEPCRRLVIVSQGSGALFAEALLRAWAALDDRPPALHLQCGDAPDAAQTARRALAAEVDDLQLVDLSPDPAHAPTCADAYPLEPLPAWLRPAPDDAVLVIGPTPFLDPVRYAFYAAGLDSKRLRFERLSVAAS